MSTREEHSVHVRHLVAVPERPAAPMSRDDLWQAVEVLTRLTGEVARRKLGAEAFLQVAEAQAVALGLWTVTR